jgi:hypothetical protein
MCMPADYWAVTLNVPLAEVRAGNSVWPTFYQGRVEFVSCAQPAPSWTPLDDWWPR